MTKSYQATEIDKWEFKYFCERCNKKHSHGSSSNTNRVEYRISHCKDNNKTVAVHITNKTVRF